MDDENSNTEYQREFNMCQLCASAMCYLSEILKLSHLEKSKINGLVNICGQSHPKGKLLLILM